MNPTSLRSNAQALLKTPPLFFCLAVGESDKTLCASSAIEADIDLQLNNFPYNRTKVVYYNDTISGTAKYTNTADIPVTIKKITLSARSKKDKKQQIDFNPNRQNVTIQPGETVTVTAASNFFESPDMNGIWEVFSSVILEDGQRFDDKDTVVINLSAACTALRAIPITSADTTSLKTFCTENPNDELCKSQQYCELSGNDNCDLGSPRQDYLDNRLQCDENVMLPETEQALLESFCDAFPNADTCKEFCERTFDSPICPDPFTVDDNIETAYVTNQIQSVAGAKTMQSSVSDAQVLAEFDCTVRGVIDGKQNQCCRHHVKNLNSNECCRYDGPNLPNGQCPRAPGTNTPPPAGGPPPPPANGCPSGTANKLGQCCKYNGPLRSTGQCPTAPGGGPAPSAPKSGGCASGTRNSIGQCCKYSGKLRSTGQCPTRAGGGGPAPKRPRVDTGGGKPPQRACAAGKVRNARGLCVSVDGSSPKTGPGYGKPDPCTPPPGKIFNPCADLDPRQIDDLR